MMTEDLLSLRPLHIAIPLSAISMKKINPNRIKFYEFLNGNIDKEEFENWICSNKELENEFDKDHYVDLISYPYKSGDSYSYILKIVKTFFSYEEYELWRTIKLLDEIEAGTVETVLATRRLRKLYKAQEDTLECPLLSVTLGIGFESVLDDCPTESEYKLWNKIELRNKLKQVKLYETDVIERAKTENAKLKLKMLSTIE